jgi:hypothetical protein
MEALQPVKLDGYAVVISEPETQLIICTVGRRATWKSHRPLPWDYSRGRSAREDAFSRWLGPFGQRFALTFKAKGVAIGTVPSTAM